tara:strand:- start:6638 stop:8467 length:1830 start_codon:yes stop_codon:yes gene_type:complete
MSKKLLIDSSNNNETRIALVDNNKLEEYEIESSSKNRIKSNVYLAKISRVEASLQAAFVDFGGNRHGFLPFAEIHPDYFKIPVADQKKLKELITKEDANSFSDQVNEDNSNEQENDDENKNDNNKKEKNQNKKKIFLNLFKKYKIQEVIKPRQVILVQVNKEERGLKGAALTTYLSFAGRYCVLMPNSNSNIGISRKIQDQEERKKLKEILDSIGIPSGMSVIIRTAGIGKIKKEIKKDLDFLVNQWNKIRENTLKSNAPKLIYEEGNVINRSIRDLYTKEISEIVIDGKEGHEIAKKYIKQLIPTQLNKLHLYKEKDGNLFGKYKLEEQISELYNLNIKLSSGGSIVINTTEALVAIDVNSGKSTNYRNIETTALNTNIEAAEEISRQIRLRDLAGLIVIDFIDMEDHRNNFKVEKVLRNAMNKDRARIQIGRISPFGLLELSRQRLKSSIIEYFFEKCHLCNGTGLIRNTGSITEQIFKVLSQLCSENKNSTIRIRCNTKLSEEILNKKRNIIVDLEKNHQCQLIFEFDNMCPLNEHFTKIESKTKGIKDSKSSNIKISKKIIKTRKKVITKKKSAPKKLKNERKKIKDNDKNENNDKKGWWSDSIS